ncbi:hypothetical protein E2C01_064532 [Portunus trituberculatus]|uniref:Uncharacterized protein n=1 Tax=Portunus trituberculatus TaxID=210409 RepID=A0A5B7HNK2_PORTR|nr:hypothetical protein [Portunus trituberculatus]
MYLGLITGQVNR